MRNIFILSLIATAIVGCSATEQQQSRENFKQVEQGTGKVLENAGETVGAGVDALDKSWETPQEQRRKEIESEKELESEKDLGPAI